MKKYLLLLLAAAVCLTPVLAEEPSMLPAVKDYAYANYTDVPYDSWYADAARACYETGLITGTQLGFEPEGILTGGQLAAIAARLREAVVGDVIPQAQEGEAWYAPYVTYLAAQNIEAPQPETAATRLQFAKLLCAVIPESYTPPINVIATLPDTADGDVLRLYNAGVLTGSDAYGTFNPQGTLRRHECAAMVARVIRPTTRQHFTLQAVPAQQPKPELTYEEELMQTEAVRVNGAVIPFQTFVDTLNSIIFRTDFGMAANGGSRLDWDAKYSGVDDLGAYFKSQALNQVVMDYLVAYQANALDCTTDQLPQALIPDPSVLLDYVYCAKHILVDDLDTANLILSQLMTSPSLAYFDQLLAQYGTDPGMKSNPNGYLFTDGDMVEEFENAVKALAIGSCTSSPVQSQFGWHIILRLDPRSYPDWEKSVRTMFYDAARENWVASSSITPNTVEINNLDARARYEQYLAQLGL